MKNNIKLQNDEIFKKNIDLIKELCLKNWIPSEIAQKVGMDRHAMIYRLRKLNFPINITNEIINNKKVCSCCKLSQLLTEFHKKNKLINNYSSKCKSCRRAYLAKNREKHIFSQVKNRAKRKQIPFNLKVSDIIIPEYCPILGVKLDTNMSMNYKYSPSLDKINPKVGYIKGNVMIISMKANLMKNDATKEELLNFSNYFIKQLNE